MRFLNIKMSKTIENKNNNRIANSVKNMSFGMMYQMMYLLLNFVVRFSIIKFLGVTALSLNSLFTEVLGVLSLAEMGVGTAITYSLYKPLAEDDRTQIVKLMNFFKRAYHLITAFMLVVGLALIPLLPYIVTKVDVNNTYLILIYVLFLLQTCVSYINSHKALLLVADQKTWVQAKINLIVRGLFFLGSLFIIIVIKNFTLYVCNEVLYNAVFYFTVAKVADKMYPYLNGKDKLSKQETKEIMTSVRQTFVGKLSNRILNSTDNILISILVGTNLVGVYSQYSMFVNGFLRLFSQVNESVVGSIGNIIAVESKSKSKETFNRLNYIFFAMGSFCSICLFAGINPFLTGIVGKNYLLENSILVMVVINMFFETFKMPLWTYFTAAGLFKYEQKISLVGCIINVITSIILGKLYGMLGIFIGTFISLLYMFINKMIILDQNHFESESKELTTSTIKYMSVFVVELIITYFVCYKAPLDINSAFIEFAIKVLIGGAISCVMSGLLFVKTDEFKYLKWQINKGINKIFQK